jgi:hypothetical protein
LNFLLKTGSVKPVRSPTPFMKGMYAPSKSLRRGSRVIL